jgi:GT2 family glycosyltransferase/glycosyltransferase involved in cell wall biosynthesis
MVRNWRFRPRFAIGISISGEQGSMLANTIDSLARQWYPEWQLAIFAADIDAPEELAAIAQIAWISNASERPCFTALRTVCEADFYAILPAGTLLEDHALQAIADELNGAPHWLAAYTDHDETGADEGGANPRFKPDFNPELLYSTNYVGPTAFLARGVLDAFRDSSEAASDSPFGLLLRTFEQTGADTIGHISDPLIHCPAWVHDEADETASLNQHFGRRGITARIDTGWFKATRRIRFACHHERSVSVIVLTHSQPGYLKTCLDSLIATAGKIPAEVIVLAHRVSDPDLDALLATFESGALGVPCTVLREAEEFRPAAFRNRAAQAASGDYLLFVDDDTEYFHQGWLADMVGHATAGDLAAVGPRLVSSSEGAPRIVGGGQILGLNGVVAPMSTGNQTILDPSCSLRLQVDQAISALPANCLLVDRHRFEALGGFDERDVPLTLHDTELCLRLRAAGGRLAWLASIDVAHHQGVTLKEENQAPAVQAAWLVQQEAEKAALLEKHLPAIANDPNYNRHLSLRSPYSIDVEAIADWNPRAHDRPRLLGLPLNTGAGQYRVIAPFKALSTAGLAQTAIIHPVGGNVLRTLLPVEIARLAPDTLVLQNCVDDDLIKVLAQSAQVNRSVRHMTTIDDRLGDLPADNPLFPIHKRHARSRLRKGLSYCSRLIVTTESLREYCADLIEDIRVVPNRLERDAWAGLDIAENEGKRPRVGWVGAMQHAGDLKLLEPVVRETAEEVDWVFMGMCPEALRPLVHEVHEFVSLRDYPAKMASLALDLAVAPLEIHPFNECKSNLRILEYGALGWPVICTDIDPYRTASAPVARLPNTPSAWIAAIRERVCDRPSLKREGTLLRQWVNANYILDEHLDSWFEALAT